MLKPSAEEKFWSKVNKTATCWLWTAGKQSAGYGAFGYKGAMALAHRISYELLIGKIPEDLQLDHLCRVRHCVNPDHLEPVTQKENLLRGDTISAIHARKTHCPQGHPYSGDNLYLSSSGRRYCKTCKRRNARNNTKKRRATN